jgi:hypothetical protein
MVSEGEAVKEMKTKKDNKSLHRTPKSRAAELRVRIK